MFKYLWPWKKEIVKQGDETWTMRKSYYGIEHSKYDYVRNYVTYKITNRWTGSETIKKVYLNE